jgi:hypothetical protein
MDDFRQATQNQWAALFMVVFGTVALSAGCKFHWAELNTAAAGIVGAGINMLTTQIRNTLNNRSGNVTLPPDPTQGA